MTENAEKDALNERAAKAFADYTNQNLHWYYAIDTHQRKSVLEDIQDHLLNLNSDTTNQCLGRIPLVISMPVIITLNHDVEGGIVNGCTGILKKKIIYIPDSIDNQYTLSCVIERPSISAEPLSTLPKKTLLNAFSQWKNVSNQTHSTSDLTWICDNGSQVTRSIYKKGGHWSSKL